MQSLGWRHSFRFFLVEMVAWSLRSDHCQSNTYVALHVPTTNHLARCGRCQLLGSCHRCPTTAAPRWSPGCSCRCRWRRHPGRPAAVSGRRPPAVGKEGEQESKAVVRASGQPAAALGRAPHAAQRSRAGTWCNEQVVPRKGSDRRVANNPGSGAPANQPMRAQVNCSQLIACIDANASYLGLQLIGKLVAGEAHAALLQHALQPGEVMPLAAHHHLRRQEWEWEREDPPQGRLPVAASLQGPWGHWRALVLLRASGCACTAGSCPAAPACHMAATTMRHASVVGGPAPAAACCSSLLSAGRAGGAGHPHLQAVQGISRECQVHDA